MTGKRHTQAGTALEGMRCDVRAQGHAPEHLDGMPGKDQAEEGDGEAYSQEKATESGGQGFGAPRLRLELPSRAVRWFLSMAGCTGRVAGVVLTNKLSLFSGWGGRGGSQSKGRGFHGHTPSPAVA